MTLYHSYPICVYKTKQWKSPIIHCSTWECMSVLTVSVHDNRDCTPSEFKEFQLLQCIWMKTYTSSILHASDRWEKTKRARPQDSVLYSFGPSLCQLPHTRNNASVGIKRVQVWLYVSVCLYVCTIWNKNVIYFCQLTELVIILWTM